MKLRNLTRRHLNINAWAKDEDGTLVRKVVTVAPDPAGAARVRYTERVTHHVDVDDAFRIDVVGRDYTSIEGVPDPVDGVFLVVCAPVARHPDLAGRDDILVPYRVIRAPGGRVVGCEGLKPGPGATL